jgi:uncharacterized protein DUF4177
MTTPSKKFVDGTWRGVLADGSVGAPCSPPTDDELRAIENEKQRQRYQRQADETGKEVWWRGERFLPAGVDPKSVAPAVPAPTPGTKSYKVITQRDEFFGGKFDPEKLEIPVNRYAADGWRVVSVATADVSTFFGTFWAGRGSATGDHRLHGEDGGLGDLGGAASRHPGVIGVV